MKNQPALDKHEMMFALFVGWYNFRRARGTTPAAATGLASGTWTMQRMSRGIAERVGRMKCVIVSIVIVSGLAALLGNGIAGQQDVAKRDIRDDRPFFAVWSSYSTADTGLGHYRGPYLRFAFWNDGRVVFAKESEKDDKPLQRGRIAAYRVARLKQALFDSGVFARKGNCYLIPDAGFISMMIDLGAHKQMLHWDEVKATNRGININPKPHHLDFMRSWEALNSLGLVACPDQFETIREKVRPEPNWSLKPPIQSE